MLQKILKSSGLDARKAAELLGISAKIFDEWVSNQKPIPPSYISMLATVLGVDSDQLAPFSPERNTASAADVAPAIWYRFRGQNLVGADRECVFLIRQFAYNFHQLEEVTESLAVGWEFLFPSIRAKINREAPPREQGRQAARLFRASRGLEQGRRGIGEVIRGNLRSMGVVVIESPIPESKLEGCTFYVGTRSNDRPCIYANTHHLTWFRRNEVLMHETGHAIFDAESSGASLDFVGTGQQDDLQEERSQAFAQEALVPKDVIRHIAQAHGMTWTELSSHDLAVLVSETQVEVRTLLRAAFDAELICQDHMDRYNQVDISSDLKSITDHALSAGEYIRKIGSTEAEKWTGKRETNIASRTLRLPVPYVTLVIDAFQNGVISRGKSAELLMIDEDTFDSRFRDEVRTVGEI
jgi:Zn-dependent peptidase ImmA (M78 family)/DNA-binding transcriptional regulator YdaS (Cro superfamily)